MMYTETVHNRTTGEIKRRTKNSETGEITEEILKVGKPSAQDDTDSMLVDHEYRLTMLELGLTE